MVRGVVVRDGGVEGDAPQQCDNDDEKGVEEEGGELVGGGVADAADAFADGVAALSEDWEEKRRRGGGGKVRRESEEMRRKMRKIKPRTKQRKAKKEETKETSKGNKETNRTTARTMVTRDHNISRDKCHFDHVTISTTILAIVPLSIPSINPLAPAHVSLRTVSGEYDWSNEEDE